MESKSLQYGSRPCHYLLVSIVDGFRYAHLQRSTTLRQTA